MHKYFTFIEEIWQTRHQLHHNSSLQQQAKVAIEQIIADLDCGTLRVAEKINDQWLVHEWLKRAILLYFQLSKSHISGDSMKWFDKIPSKFFSFVEEDFKAANYRIVPGSSVRYGAYIAKDVLVMPSFINIGAYIDSNTTIDTWATIGSCAQIGKNCHISGGAGIGGVLEPIQARPVIIEDNCFIGARSEIVEGVIVQEGAVISMGVFIGASTKIVYRDTGEIIYGKVPAYCVVVPGSLPSVNPALPSLYCAVIVKQVDESTRRKTSINELLRG